MSNMFKHVSLRTIKTKSQKLKICNCHEIQFHIYHYFRFGRKKTSALRQARNGIDIMIQTTGSKAKTINLGGISEVVNTIIFRITSS